jgi:hypothetical protein
MEHLRADNPDGLWSTPQQFLGGIGVSDPEVVGTVSLISAWNTSDGLKSGIGVALRLSVGSLFGTRASCIEHFRQAISPASLKQAETLLAGHERGIVSFLEAQYRGARLLDRETGVYDPNLWPLSSFSLSVQSARAFTAPSFTSHEIAEPDAAPALIIATVPPERVLSSSCTGLASSYEAEIVVVGPQDSDDRAWHVVGIDADSTPDDVWDRVERAKTDS